jgi:hypothetical protein
MRKSVEELAEECGAYVEQGLMVQGDGLAYPTRSFEFTSQQLESFVSALSIQQEADAKDAARYRWLSAACNNWMIAPISVSEFNTVSWETIHSSTELDAAIDTAMATPTDSEEK